jgi:hypothetical protein
MMSTVPVDLVCIAFSSPCSLGPPLLPERIGYSDQHTVLRLLRKASVPSSASRIRVGCGRQERQSAAISEEPRGGWKRGAVESASRETP